MSFHDITTVPVDFAIPLGCLGNLYRFIILPNGIRSLLISSPQSTTAAVAVCVATGSHNDHDLPGLAHLCEHMVFAGLKQYPRASQFHKLINDHQGHVNAYTLGEYTTFHYDVDTMGYASNTPVFEHTLAMFASFLRRPLVPTKLLAKEIAAIHGEHTRNTSDIDRILYHGMRLITDETHPFHQFGTGDKTTLSSRLTLQLRELVVQFYRDHYVAKNVTVVVKGPQLLNHLQKVVFTNFTDFSSNQPPSTHKPTSSGFTQGQFLHIKSTVKEKLRLVFPVMADTPQREFFIQCWCNLLGDESTGSLGNYLRHEKHFILAIYVHSMTIASEEKVLLIDIDLLPKGVYHLDEVIATTNAYISQFLGKVTPQLVKYISDVYFILQLGFYFRTVTDIAEEVSSLASSLHQTIPAEDLIKGFASVSEDIRLTHQVATELAHELVADLTQYLSPTNCSFIYLGDDIQRMSSYLGVEEQGYDPHYHIDYNRCALLSIPSCCVPGDAKFCIPPSNPYIEGLTGFNLKNQSSTHNNMFGAASATSDIHSPILLQSLDHHEIWYQPCLWQHCTHVLFSLEVSATSIGSDSFMDLAMVLLAHWIGELLLPKLYAAEMIGYQWGIYSNWNEVPLLGFHVLGLSLGIAGVLETIVGEINHIFENLETVELSDKTFRGVKSKYLHFLELMKTKSGVEQALVGRLLYTETQVPDHAARIDKLKQLDVTQFKECLEIFNHQLGYSRLLVLTQEGEDFVCDIAELVNSITDHFQWNPKVWPQSYVLPSLSMYRFTQPSMNPEDLMNTVLYYIQLGQRHNQQLRLWAELINFYINLYAVSELRLKRQLGYHVMLVFVMARTTVGVMIVVSSPKWDETDVVIAGINDFLQDLERKIASMLEAQFITEIVELFLASEPRNSSLFFRKPSAGQVDHTASPVTVAHWDNWERIYNHDYQFQSIDHLLAENITRDRFLSVFQLMVSLKNRKAFVVNVTPGVSDDARKSVMAKKIKDIVSARGMKVSANELDDIISQCDTMEQAMERVILQTQGLTKGILFKTAKLLKKSPNRKLKQLKRLAGNDAITTVTPETLSQTLSTEFTMLEVDQFKLSRDFIRLLG